MPLREISEFHAWIKRESPSPAAERTARVFIAKLGATPWQTPSIPLPELSNQPEYELRTASLPVPDEPDIEIWYLHAYANGDIDIIAVTNH